MKLAPNGQANDMSSARVAIVAYGVMFTTGAFAAQPNDTGIDFCRDHATGMDSRVGATTTCEASLGGQDARYGRDPGIARGNRAKVGAGAKGFDFSKVSNDGRVIPAAAKLGDAPEDWACTLDHVSGLLWEMKVNDSKHLRNTGWRYTWYDSVHNFGGNPGANSGGTCLTPGRCDTEKYVADINAVGLCGQKDWRMPSADELGDLVDMGIGYTSGQPTIDPAYFPNTAGVGYWTGTPVAAGESGAWFVFFSYGGLNWGGRFTPAPVRLVRGGK
jgi:hypothetical protein